MWNKTENLLCPPNGCFSVSESMSVTDLQTYRATTRGPGGPKKFYILFPEDSRGKKICICISIHSNSLGLFQQVQLFFLKQKYRKSFSMSQNPRKENPRNSPRLPPTSAMNDSMEYNHLSSLTFRKVLENPKLNPTDSYSPSSKLLIV